MLSNAHATQFLAYCKYVQSKYALSKILSGAQRWPDAPEDRDVLYFLAQSLRAQLYKELPAQKGQLSPEAQQLSYRAKPAFDRALVYFAGNRADGRLRRGLASPLPDWFLVELVRELPALVKRRNGA